MPCSEIAYAFLRELVLKESGNYIDPSRNALFDARLAPLARVAGAPDLETFVAKLRNRRETSADSYRAVSEAMLIHETSFFRDLAPFELLRRTVIPGLIHLRRTERRLRLWSAASSTGQEAYSLAMLLCEHFPAIADWDVRVIGTDISPRARDYAERGRYNRVEINRGLPAKLMVKYFRRDGEEWEAIAKLRRMVEFRVANLCAPLPPLPVFDVVLLRNVLLYFPRQDRGCVLTDVHRRLHPQGALLLGAAEQAEDSTNLFRASLESDSFFYRPAA